MGMPADIIKFLQDDGLSAAFFDSHDPAAKVARVLVVRSYGGEDPLENHDGADKRIDRPRFQIDARDPDPAVAEELCTDALNRVARIKNWTINGTRYVKVTPVSHPRKLKVDEQGRTSYTANCAVMKAPQRIGV